MSDHVVIQDLTCTMHQRHIVMWECDVKKQKLTSLNVIFNLLLPTFFTFLQQVKFLHENENLRLKSFYMKTLLRVNWEVIDVKSHKKEV